MIVRGSLCSDVTVEGCVCVLLFILGWWGGGSGGHFPSFC